MKIILLYVYAFILVLLAVFSKSVNNYISFFIANIGVALIISIIFTKESNNTFTSYIQNHILSLSIIIFLLYFITSVIFTEV